MGYSGKVSGIRSCAVSLRDVAYRYPGEAHDALSVGALDISSGECVALIGASGAGKSTLLRLLDGRLRGWSGQGRVLGRRLDPHRPPPRAWRCEVGFVFQEFALIEQATVWRNVLNGRLGRTDAIRSLFGRFTDGDEQAAEQALRDVGIEELAGRRADRLSGGQRQRVAIARCLAQDPRLILADEPVSNLDPMTAEVILALLRDCAKRRGAALLVSSHQHQLAAPYVDRFVMIDRGRIVSDGTPEAYRNGHVPGIHEDATHGRWTGPGNLL